MGVVGLDGVSGTVEAHPGGNSDRFFAVVERKQAVLGTEAELQGKGGIDDALDGEGDASHIGRHDG